ncbi:hypothetical protein LGT39_13470 [Demequina sp. TTPB684]|uniref:hypothetical protein n=1 Tax=unclassified Demequina TaxID=2620311 RepID=UPI001CF43498|nr:MULTISPECIES: hypothetical protein [unclassified Demequina]MCB2413855.1 hypothetical protein [Demequina sp. TTPB684]UPU89167.1 hypothetical protein LGT36_004370 [Demequina sp. TMPB413]
MVEALQIVFVILHLVGMAAIVGGALEQWRVGERGITAVMVWGARAQIVTGVFLAGMAFGDDDESPNHWKIAVKFLIALGVAGMCETGSRRESAKRMWAGALALTLVNVAIAVAWH